MAEVLQRGLLRVRAFRPEIADLEWLLLRKAGGHDFAEHAHQHRVVQRAFVAIDDAAKHLRFAFRSVVIDRSRQLALGATDLRGELRAFADQRLDLAIDPVDAFPQPREFLRRPRAHPCRLRKSSMNSTSAATPASGIAL
ncbi:hypothetical protein PAGU2638_18680 [Lysobacter sp. PAGU 2638]